MVRSKNVPGGAVLYTQSISLKKDKAFILSSYDKTDVDAKYARRFVSEEPIHSMWKDEDTQFLIFRIYCHDEGVLISLDVLFKVNYPKLTINI